MRSLVVAAAVFIAVFLCSGCCQCPKSFRSVEDAIKERSLCAMSQAMHWLKQHDYTCTLQQDGGEGTLIAVFAEEPGSASACTWVVTTNRYNLLTVTVFFPPSAPPRDGAEIARWAAQENSVSLWGFFGFMPQERVLWFRISLMCPGGRLDSDEMQQLVDEIFLRMLRGWTFLDLNVPVEIPPPLPLTEARTAFHRSAP